MSEQAIHLVHEIMMIVYWKGFDQRVARQQLCKHGPTCNNIGENVFSMWSAPSNNRNWVLCDQLLG
jgi:hypothetical protein